LIFNIIWCHFLTHIFSNLTQINVHILNIFLMSQEYYYPILRTLVNVLQRYKGLFIKGLIA